MNGGKQLKSELLSVLQLHKINDWSIDCRLAFITITHSLRMGVMVKLKKGMLSFATKENKKEKGPISRHQRGKTQQ